MSKVRDFFPRNQSAGYSFLKSPIAPLKSQMLGHKASHELFWLSSYWFRKWRENPSQAGCVTFSPHYVMYIANVFKPPII